MNLLLIGLAAFGLWRVIVVLRGGVADRSTGAILLITAPLLALPIVGLAIVGKERDINVPVEQGMIAGALGAACVVLGLVLLVAGKKQVK